MIQQYIFQTNQAIYSAFLKETRLFSDKKRRIYDNPMKTSNLKDGDLGRNPFSFQSNLLVVLSSICSSMKVAAFPIFLS